MMPVLDVKDLVCSYGTTPVLNGVSFSVEEGGCLGLIGDSGSGKSTIARCIAGLTRPDAGSISLLGKNAFPDTGNRSGLRGKVQMLFQDHTASLDPLMSVGDSVGEGIRARLKNIDGGGAVRGAGISAGGAARVAGIPTGNGDDADMLHLLHRVGLDADAAIKYPRQLSGGERQRAALARALSVEPALLVLDEPTASLDADTQIQILDLLRSVQETSGAAILFISHDIGSVVRLCGRMAVLYGGRIVEHGATAAVLARPSHEYTQRIADLHARA